MHQPHTLSLWELIGHGNYSETSIIPKPCDLLHFQWQGTVVLNSTALNLNNRLFRASASFDNKIKTMSLICLAKSLTATPTRSLCMILIPASCLQTVSGTITFKSTQTICFCLLYCTNYYLKDERVPFLKPRELCC